MTADELGLRLSKISNRNITCDFLSDNGREISFLRGKSGFVIRLPRFFAEAPPDILLALASYCVKPQSKYAQILKYYSELQHHEQKPERDKDSTAKSVKGIHHDLSSIFEKINRTHFENLCDARIKWAKRTCPRNIVRLGSYEFAAKIIRIHPMLDNPEVPASVVEEIVFHEMLHWKYGAQKRENRNVYHPREMRMEESTFPDSVFVKKWRKEQFPALLKKYRYAFRKMKRTSGVFH